MRGDVFYCRTAMDGVNVMNQIMGNTDLPAYYEDNRRKLVRKHEQAQRRLEKESHLFATLPRRSVPPNPLLQKDIPLFRNRVVTCSLQELEPHIDRHTLFALNWRFGGPAGRERYGHNDEEMENLLQEWIAKAGDKGWIKPQGVFGLFPCYSEGEQVILLNPEDGQTEIARLDFASVLGAGNEDIVSAAQYFSARDAGARDIIGLQLTTAGAQVEDVVEAFKRKDDYESALFLQGLSDRIAEDMAERIHGMMRELVGVDAQCGQRWSPGYPGMKDIMHNVTIHTALQAEELVGVSVTEAGEFRPTGTTAAAVSFHPDARYT